MALDENVIFPADYLHSTLFHLAYPYSIPSSVRFFKLLLLFGVLPELPAYSRIYRQQGLTVSRRSEPSSRTTLIGEQPNHWELLHPQDVMHISLQLLVV